MFEAQDFVALDGTDALIDALTTPAITGKEREQVGCDVNTAHRHMHVAHGHVLAKQQVVKDSEAVSRAVLSFSHADVGPYVVTAEEFLAME